MAEEQQVKSPDAGSDDMFEFEKEVARELGGAI